MGAAEAWNEHKTRIKSALDSRWALPSATVLTGFHIAVFTAVIAQPGRLPMRSDSAIFQYAGWRMAEGATLYTEIWEVKFPLAYKIPALLAFVSAGSPRVHHILNIALTISVAVGSGLLVGLLVRDLTDDKHAAFLSAISVLLLPGYFYLPAFGFKAKFYVTFFMLLSVYLVRRGYPFLSGASAAACIGFYQAALVVPFLAVGLGYQKQQVRGAIRAIAGGIALKVLTIVPVLRAGALEEMFVQVVLVSLILESSSGSILQSILRGGRHFSFAAPGVLIGGVGILLSLSDYDWRDTWWISVAGVWFAIVAMFLDYDNFPDLIPGLMIVALGVGIVYHAADSPDRKAIIAGVIVLCLGLNLMNVLVFSGAVGGYPIDKAEPLSNLENVTHENGPDAEFQVMRPDIKYLYWTTADQQTCHVRLSSAELEWLRLTGKPISDKSCGDLDRASEYM